MIQTHTTTKVKNDTDGAVVSTKLCKGLSRTKKCKTNSGVLRMNYKHEHRCTSLMPKLQPEKENNAEEVEP
jgi:hypothetical protein